MKAKYFAILIIAFLIGVVISGYLESSTHAYLTLAIIFIIVSFVYRKNFFFAIPLVLTTLFLGVFLSQSQEVKYSDLNKELAKKKLTFTAIVDEIPTETEHGSMTKARVIKVNENEKNFFLIIFLKKNQKLEYGDLIKFKSEISIFKAEKKGQLIKNRVAGETYLNEFEKIGKSSALGVKGSLYFLRQKMNLHIFSSLPKDEAGLASGLILGEKSLVQAESKRLMQDAGVTHIIALSGYNITIILGLFSFLKTRHSRLVNLLVPLVFISSFVVMTGAAASIVRAGVMGFMPILARFLGRPKSSLMAILFSAFIMVLLNPYIFLYDVGFQLSFAALLGLTYITPIFLKIVKKDNEMIQIFIETISAQIAVLPLIMFYFGRVSIISPLSNLVILLLVPAGMLIAFVVGLFGFVHPLASQIVAIPGYIVLKIFNSLIGYFGGLPFASTQMKIDKLWLIIFYLIIINLVFIAKKYTYNISEA